MNTMPPYQLPPLQPKPRKAQFPPVLLGIAYMVMHIVLLYAVQIVAIVVLAIQAAKQLGDDITTEEVTEFVEKILYSNSEIISIITQFLTVAVVILIFVIIYCVKKEDRPSPTRYFSLKKVKPSVIAMSALLAFGAYFIVVGFISALSNVFPDFVNDYNETMESVTSADPNWILQFITLVIGAPLCEELIYRNMAITNLSKRLSPIVSVIITSAVFGVAHGVPLQILYAGALGVVFGIIFVRTDSIYPSLVAHAVFNALGFGFSVLGEYVEVGTPTETTINIVIAIITVLSLAGVPLAFWWLIKHTNTPKRQRATAPQVSAVPVVPPSYYPQNNYSAPYPPQNPYGQQGAYYPPQNPYGQQGAYYPPQYPYGQQGVYYPPQNPPQGYVPTQQQRWVFDQRYGWILVGPDPTSMQTPPNTPPSESPTVTPTDAEPQNDSTTTADTSSSDE